MRMDLQEGHDLVVRQVEALLHALIHHPRVVPRLTAHSESIDHSSLQSNCYHHTLRSKKHGEPSRPYQRTYKKQSRVIPNELQGGMRPGNALEQGWHPHA